MGRRANCPPLRLRAVLLFGVDMTEARNTINVPIAGSPRFQQDTVLAIGRLKASVMSPDSEPTFAGITLTDLTASKLTGTDADKGLQSISVGNSLSLTGTELNAIQDIRTSASPTFVSLSLTDTDSSLDAGGWFGKPDPISPHSNIYGDLFVGISHADGWGRVRIGSNSAQGFLQWNRYYDGSASQQLDATRPSFVISMSGGGDYFAVQRSPAGSTTLANLLYIDGPTGVVILPYMSSAGFVKNDASGNLSGGNSIEAGDIPDLSDTYQPLNSDLTTLGGLAKTNGNFIVGNGTAWVAESGNTARTSLGLGTGDSPTFTQVTVAPGELNTGFVSNATGVALPMFRWQESGTDKWIIASRPGDSSRLYVSATPSGTGGSAIATGAVIAIEQNGNTGFGINSPQEDIHAADTVRADTAFNLNGTDGVTQAAAAGTVCDVTAIAGGIATAQTQITYATDGTYNFDATSGKVSSITITNGRITAITTAS